MSRLSVYHQSSPHTPNKVLNHAEDIVSTLAAVGIELRSLQLDVRLQPGIAADEVLAEIAKPLEQLKRDYGLLQVDVISLDRNPWPKEDQPPVSAPEEKISEGQQLYLFLGGEAQLNLRIGEYLYEVVGERNEVLVVPAGVGYWLELGEVERCLVVVLSVAEV